MRGYIQNDNIYIYSRDNFETNAKVMQKYMNMDFYVAKNVFKY